MSGLATEIITTLISFLMSVINFILTPIDTFIVGNIPGLSYALQLIGNFFDYIGNLVPWVVSYFGLSIELINLVVAVLSFKILLIIFDDGIKFIVKWYNALKF